MYDWCYEKYLFEKLLFMYHFSWKQNVNPKVYKWLRTYYSFDVSSSTIESSRIFFFPGEGYKTPTIAKFQNRNQT